jgi:hypothetical protein
MNTNSNATCEILPASNRPIVAAALAIKRGYTKDHLLSEVVVALHSVSLVKPTGAVHQDERVVLTSQCLDRRMSDKRFLKSEVAAWEANRNRKHTKANWRFTTESARVKLKNLYPSF